MKTSRIASLAAFLTAAAGLGMSPSVFADCTTPQTFTVTSPNDDGGTGTLRFLINSASTKDCDTIEIPAMLIVLDGTLGQIELKKSITLHGAGAGSAIIDANGGVSNDRAFEIDPDDTGVGVEMSGLTIRNGNTAGDGGGILVSNHGTLGLVDSEVVGNQSGSYGGGISVPDHGGLILENSSVSENKSGDYGGGIYIYDEGSVGLIHGSIIDGNDANNSGSGGGGIYNEYTSLEITNSKVTNNKGSYGGGVWNEDGAVYIYDSEISGNLSDGSSGGGIQNDYTMIIDNCDIKNNRATGSSGDGGGIQNEDGGQVTILNSTIDGNRADNDGGGINNDYYNVNIVNCTISNNIADADGDGSGGGGGVGNNGGYNLQIAGSLIINNVSNGDPGGGGVYQDGYASIDNTTIADNTASNGSGGGIYADSEPTVVRNVTISGNKALGNDGSDDSDGGGIHNEYPMFLVNCTIANNEADGDGGGLYEDGEGTTFNNVTITGNTADANEGGLSGGDGGGIFNNLEVSLSNSIVAGNQDKSAGNEAPDCFNDFTGSSTGFKLVGPTLIQDTTGCEIQGNPGLLINADPQFDSSGLADNGGAAQGDAPTQNVKTVKLADGSPAIDAGDNGSCETTDENGAARPSGDNCDLGAVENAVSGGTTGGATGGETGGETTGGTTGGTGDSGGCSLIR